MLADAVSARDLLRHCLATVAYRGGKALRDAPASFADFQAGESTRTRFRFSPMSAICSIGL
jgi:hypothetical protein